MKLTQLRNNWCLEVRGSINEILEAGPDFWREKAYINELVIFKQLGKITDEQIYQLCSYFGKPWSKEEYKYSREITYDINYKGQDRVLTRINNVLSPRVGTSAMRWHSDIPLREPKSYPWRGLYMTVNPHPESGLTSWLMMRLDHLKLSEEKLNYYNSIDLTMHSWLEHGKEVLERKFIKTDPIKHFTSLGLDCYSSPEFPNMWIKNTRVNGIESNNAEILDPIYKELENRPELNYTHKWDLYDFAIYSNWHMVHNRTQININPGEIREFIRVNIDHITDDNWLEHKKEI